MLTLIMVWAMIPMQQRPVSAEESGSISDSVNIGEYVTFGHYEQDNNLENGKEPIEWKVLDKKDGRVLLLRETLINE